TRTQPRRRKAAPHRRHGVVDQEISEHRVAEGPADERCHHRVSQGRAPLSLNPTRANPCFRSLPSPKCENPLELPLRPHQRRFKKCPHPTVTHCAPSDQFSVPAEPPI